MELTALILIIVSALLHSIWNAGLKTVTDVSAGAVLLGGIACLIALVAGSGELGSALTAKTFPFTIGAGLFAGFSLATISLAFQGSSLGLAYTISRAGAILLLWPVSFFYLGEKITPTGVAGAAILTVSLSLMMLQGKKEKLNQHLWWAAASALCIVGYSVFYKKAVTAGANHFALLGVSDVIRVAIAYLLLGKERRSRVYQVSKTSLGRLCILGLMSFGGFSIYLHALKDSGAAQLTTLRNLSILFTAVAAHYLGEKLGLKSYGLIFISLIGTILVGIK